MVPIGIISPWLSALKHNKFLEQLRCRTTVQPSARSLSQQSGLEPLCMGDSSTAEGDDWGKDGKDHEEHLTSVSIQ